MMRRLLYLLLLWLAIGIHASARTPMRQWLVSMPDSVMPLLTKNDRLDFIDFYDAQMVAVVTNRMEGKSRMDILTDDFVHIAYTNVSDIAMKLLPINDSTDVLCMVATVKAAVSDSRIAFFDAQWQPLEVSSYITEPTMRDFRSTLQNDSVEWAWAKVNILFRTYALCAGRAELQCVCTATDYLSDDERAEVAPYVRKEPLLYRWINGKFVCDEQ